MANRKTIQPKQASSAKSSNAMPSYYKWLVFLLPVLLYTTTLFFGYNLDDELVTINHRLTSKGVSAISEIFSSPYYQDQYGYAYEYRPIVLVTFAIEHQLFGDSAAAGHFINVLLYAACCLLLFRVLIRLFPQAPTWVPLAMVLLYTVHTTHTEVVASIKNRDELLALFFSLVTFGAVDLARSNKWWWVVVPVAFTLALLSKTTALCFLIIIPVAFIMLKEAKLSQALLITALLSVPTFAFINMQSGFGRLLVVSAVFFVVIGMYVLLNLNSVVQYVVALPGRIWSLSKGDVSNDTSSKEADSWLPPTSLFRVKYIVPALLTLAFVTWANVGGYGIAVSVFLVLLFGVSLLNKNEIAWWANAALVLVIAQWAYVLPYETYDISLYEKVTTFYLLYLLVYGKRNFVIPVVIALALHTFRLYQLTFNLLDTVSVLVGLLLCFHRYTRIIPAALVAFVIFREVTNTETVTHILVSITRPALFLILLLALTFQSISKYASKVYSFLVVAMGIFMVFTSPQSLTKDVVATVEVAANQASPQIIEKQDRPLHYTEQVVMPDDPISLRLGTSLEILLHYLGKTILPYPLSFYYGYKFITPMSVTDPLPLLSIALHLLILIAAVWCLNKNRVISFGLFTYLLSIAVFSDYFQYVPGMVADRYLLVPTLGWSIVLVGILMQFSKNALTNPKFEWSTLTPAVKYSFTGIFVAYSLLSFSRNLDWKDDLTLFRHDIKYVDESAQANNLLALHLMQHSAKETDQVKQMQLTQEALSYFQRAQDIYPGFFNVAYDIGRVYSILGKPDSAIIAYEKAITIDTLFPEVYLKLGDLYYEQQNLEKANENFRVFIRKQPYDYTGYNKLSYNLYVMKRYEESLAVNREAIQKVPGVIDPYLNIARTFIDMKNNDSAYYYMNRADQLQPNNPQIQSALQQLKAGMNAPR